MLKAQILDIIQIFDSPNTLGGKEFVSIMCWKVSWFTLLYSVFSGSFFVLKYLLLNYVHSIHYIVILYLMVYS